MFTYIFKNILSGIKGKMIGIIGATSIEIQFIKDNVFIESKEKYAGFEFYICKYKNINLVLTRCSVGKVNASSCTQILIDKFNIKKLINVGIAGSLNNNVNLGDIVISDNITYHDVSPYQMKNCFPFKKTFSSCDEFKEIALKAYEISDLKDYNCHIGKIITGDIYIDDTDIRNNLINIYSPYCVDMEGAAIAHVCDINDIPFINIKSISDKADDNASIAFKEFEVIASNNSAKLARAMLDFM